jgi:hypothetical protein
VAPVPRKRAFAAGRRPPSPDGVSNDADENGDETMSTIGIPIPGTPAYWTAQREAVALVHAWQRTELGADDELALLRRIAAHGFASRMMAAHGADVARWVAILETLRELFDDDIDEDDEEDEDADPDGPPYGQDWCRRGCQILYGMECGMCGYEGRGVWASQVETVAEHCCHCNARTRQSPEGICELCGKDAETPDVPAQPPASCFWDCGPVSQDAQCRLCRDLERHAQGAAAQAAPAHGIVDGAR